MKSGRPRCQSRFRFSAASFLVAMLAVGCSHKPAREPPKTYPVTGEFADTGGRNIAGTLIQFAPGNVEHRSQAIVDANGKFSLRMLFGNEHLEGAVEGPHEVTVYFPLDKIPSDGNGVLKLAKPCVIRPEPNHVSIELPALRK